MTAGIVGMATVGTLSGRLRDRVNATIIDVLSSVGEWASGVAARYGDRGATDPPGAALAAAREVAVDAAVEGLIVLDQNGVVIDCNSVAADVIAVERGVAVGQSIAELDPEIAARIDGSNDELADDLTDVRGEPRDHGSARRQPYVTRMTDEGKRHYEVRVTPFERPDLEGRVIALQDATNRRRLRRRVGVLNRLLRHDLRNEMNVVLGYTELLEERRADRTEAETGDDDRQVATALDRITGAAETMLDRAETVRHVEATLDADEPTKTHFDVARLVRAQVDGLAMEYPAVDPQITVDAPESAWITATGLIDTVFTNLLENAIEHSHRERPTIEITVVNSGAFVAVTVADDGPGIPMQELETFETETETAVTHSSGLGLWLVVWITESSGGRVSFDVDETGTAVTVEFPAADPPGD
ncbi:ATP-binding protein [Halobaculum halobium]|uniref:histidine kinase n=1 Tax=Halobaculum halobium TaxID=3032281 RepID=A0ABD5T817_9EURY|nr:PAS domain-containing sensor histidine kinase [Halobaculum sp. SYNS20]